MAAPHEPHARGAFYGRRKGHRLRDSQARLMAELLPRLTIDLTAPPPERLADLFASPVRAVRLEIGFGGAEHLLHEADAAPDIGFIGVEPFINGMAKALAALDARPRANLRLLHDDALKLLAWLPDGALERIDLLYPDPWPKTRHHKRRFVQTVTVEAFARVLRPGGTFRFASDIPDYVEWTLGFLAQNAAFRSLRQTAQDQAVPYSGWPGTRYEAKALREGRKPAYLVFQRL
jgi:tRNA (guanine-N7-)-methyltransferase